MRQTARSIMVVAIFLVVWFAVALAEGNGDGYSEFEVLQNLMNYGRKNVSQTFDRINETSVEFDVFVEERLNALMWEGTVQQQNLNKTVTEAICKGISKKKQFTNFQCISKHTRDTFEKLDAIQTQTSVYSQKLSEIGLGEITEFRMILMGFYDYIHGFHKSKENELKNEKNQDERKKILNEAVIKMKFLALILEEISTQMKSVKFKAMEEYINFAFNAEKNFKNTQKKGASEILKCVA